MVVRLTLRAAASSRSPGRRVCSVRRPSRISRRSASASWRHSGVRELDSCQLPSRRTRDCVPTVSYTHLYRGAEYSVNFLPKVKIDVAIADDQLDEVIDVISKAAYTGKIGDGKIFVAELQRVIRCV